MQATVVATQPVRQQRIIMPKTKTHYEPIKGEKGEKGDRGETGPPGLKGDKGDDGDPGSDGRGILDAQVDNNGHLILRFTDGTVADTGRVVGNDGKDGVIKTITEIQPYKLTDSDIQRIIAALPPQVLEIYTRPAIGKEPILDTTISAPLGQPLRILDDFDTTE